MPERTLTERIEILEQEVEGLETLPARVAAIEWQILQLREEIRAGDEAVRTELRTEIGTLREEIRAGDEALRVEFRTEMQALREEIREGDEETRRYMRVLHEDVISRLAIIQEGRPSHRFYPISDSR